MVLQVGGALFQLYRALQRTGLEICGNFAVFVGSYLTAEGRPHVRRLARALRRRRHLGSLVEAAGAMTAAGSGRARNAPWDRFALTRALCAEELGEYYLLALAEGHAEAGVFTIGDELPHEFCFRLVELRSWG